MPRKLNVLKKCSLSLGSRIGLIKFGSSLILTPLVLSFSEYLFAPTIGQVTFLASLMRNCLPPVTLPKTGCSLAPRKHSHICTTADYSSCTCQAVLSKDKDQGVSVLKNRCRGFKTLTHRSDLFKGSPMLRSSQMTIILL